MARLLCPIGAYYRTQSSAKFKQHGEARHLHARQGAPASLVWLITETTELLLGLRTQQQGEIGARELLVHLKLAVIVRAYGI